MTDEGALLRRLEEVVALERDALLRADHAAIGALGPKLEMLSQQILPLLSSLDRPVLNRLSRSMRDLRRLSLASLSGITAARSRLDALAGRGTELSTYDVRGRLSSVSFGASSVERRG
ncbi:hypothetical protein N5I32_19525 [Acidimangrovimonas sediminis]|uniref:Flagellar protein FlgN n=1 Tax=Albidovulum sediminis TaxID=3066345 RepID=A0ABT2NS00_9RHOB|nr:hypothetical protein [Defluviimonas sediminis]